VGDEKVADEPNDDLGVDQDLMGWESLAADDPAEHPEAHDARLSVDGSVGGPNIQIAGDVGGDVLVVAGVPYIAEFADEAEASLAGQREFTESTLQARINRSRYRATIQKIFARCPAPVDQEIESAMVAEFLASDEPYMWWAGEPYSGKTTLAASIAGAPPPGVVPVAFFVSRADGTRLEDYRTALADQLAPLAGQSQSRYQLPHGFDLDDIWQGAAEKVRSAGQTLLLIVDGLDEDAYHGRHGISIASQLPESCPYGSKVIVTSRQAPDILATVGEGHPLRSCTQWRLRANEASAASRRTVEQELHLSLADQDWAVARAYRAILGLLAAAGGHLSASDLTMLTEADFDLYEVTQFLEHRLGRLVESREEFGERRYVFAHDLIRSQAITLLGEATLTQHRLAIGAWAGELAAAGWPEHTPTYLLDQYPRLLAEEADVTALLALQTPTYYQLQHLRFGSNDVALQGITDLISLLSQDGSLDFPTLLRLVMWADHLKHAMLNLPSCVPEAWSMLGRFDKAEHLARVIGDPVDCVDALARIARAAAKAGQTIYAQDLLEDAELIAFSLQQSDARAVAIKVIVRALNAIGNHGHVQLLLERAFAQGDRSFQEKHSDEFVTVIATAAAETGHADLALRALQALSPRRTATRAAVRAADQAGRHEVAEQIIYRRGRPAALYQPSLFLLRTLLVLAGRAGHRETAEIMLDNLVVKSKKADDALRLASSAAAEAGLLDRAEEIARTIRGPYELGKAFTGIAQAAVAQGNTACAGRAFDDLARNASSFHRQPAWALLATTARDAFYDGDQERMTRLLAQVLDLITLPDVLGSDLAAAAGRIQVALGVDRDPGMATELVRDAARAALSLVGQQRDTKLGAIARMAARIGLLEDAEAIAELITSPEIENATLADIVVTVASDLDQMERLTARIPDSKVKLPALRHLAIVAAKARRFDMAQRTATQISDHSLRATTLADASAVAAAAGCLAEAESLLCDGNQVRGYILVAGLGTIAQAAIAADRVDLATRLLNRAEKMARMTPRDTVLGTPLGQVAASANAEGLEADAEAIMTFLDSPVARGRAMAALVQRSSQPGRHVRNRRLLDGAVATALEVTDPAAMASVLLDIAQAAVRVGDDEHASQTVELVSRVTRDTMTDARTQVATVLNLAQAFIDSGDTTHVPRLVDSAREFALKAAPPSNKGPTLAFICRWASRNGRLDEAEGVAVAIPRPSWRAAALTSVAFAAWTAKDHQRARRLIKDAEAEAAKIDAKPRRADQLCHIARAAGSARDGKTARRLIREVEGITSEITSVDMRCVILAQVARSCARLGDASRTQRLIVEALAALGEVEEKSLFGMLSDALARTALIAGLDDDAARIARGMSGVYPKFSTLTYVGASLVKAGDIEQGTRLLEEAVSVAARLLVRKQRVGGIAMIAETAAEAGLYDVAERFATSSRGMRYVALTAARVGRLDYAEDIADRIESPESRCQTRGDLALAAAAAGDQERAERLLLRSLRDAATLPVDLFVKLWPPAAATVAATLAEIRGLECPAIGVT
jgi:hypothetical protein